VGDIYDGKCYYSFELMADTQQDLERLGWVKKCYSRSLLFLSHLHYQTCSASDFFFLWNMHSDPSYGHHAHLYPNSVSHALYLCHNVPAAS